MDDLIKTLCFGNPLYDLGLLYFLRDLVYSFLLSKRNQKGAKKIHKSQSLKNRLTLSYIEEHAVYQKQFKRFYRLRLGYIYALIPQYVILAASFIISKNVALAYLMLLFAVKIVLLFYIGHYFSSKISIFDKRYKEREKRKKK